LLDAARAVFAERGFTQATMEAIAERANSTKPTLYAHFGDKVALYRVTVAREVAALQQWMITTYESADPQPVEQRVRVYVMAMFTYATTQPDSFRMLFDSVVDEMSPERRQLAETIRTHVATQIRDYLVTHDRPHGPSVDLLAAMMVGLVGRAANHVSHAPHLDPLAAGELASSFIVAALRGIDPALLERLDVPEASVPQGAEQT